MTEPVETDARQDRPTTDFDHHSAAFARDPWSVYADLRARCPVSWSEAHGGFWVLARHDEVRGAALDDYTFSSAHSVTVPAKPAGFRPAIPIEVDPPNFLEYRRILNPRFSPAAIAEIEPQIHSFVSGLIDTFIDRGHCDLVLDFTNPLPALTTLHLLGLPIEDWEAYAAPLHQKTFMRNHTPQQEREYEDVHVRVREAIVERRNSPNDDLISYLLAQQAYGEPLTDDDVLDMVMLILHGGFDTTGSAIANAVLYLDEHREHRERLIAEPGLIPQAVEELIRYEAPQQGLGRVATRDVEIDGHCIRSGDRLLLLWASANRDEEAFPEPDKVILDRFPNRHLTFGVGAHRCLGSNIARTQIQVALAALLDRLPDFEVERSALVRADTVGVVFGHFSVPISFTPGPRRLPAGQTQHLKGRGSRDQGPPSTRAPHR